MGFGDLSSAAHIYPSLSTVRVDGAVIGVKAAESLLSRFAQSSAARHPSLHARIDTGFTIIDRQST